MEHDDQTHVCSTHCPPRCFSLEHASRQLEAYRNWRLARTFSAESVASLGPQSLDWQQLRSDLKQGGATEFSLEVWDTLREFIRPPPVRLLVHASQPGRPLPFGPSPDVDRSLDGAKKLLELLDQEPGDVSEGKASFGGPRTATQLNSFEEGKDMTHASHIRRLKERGETKNAHIIASLEAQDALAEEGRIVDCWQKKHRQFWYVILYMSSRTSIGDHTTAVLVQMLDKLYGLCYNHKESCPGHQNRGPVHHFRCAEKPSCQSELENPFKHERYLWFWERLPECWNAYEFFAPVFRTVVQHKGSMRTMHSNCIFSEDFTPFVPTGGPYPIHTSKQDGTKTRKQATQLAGIEWIRLNAFLARFVRLRGEDKPFVHEGGKHYNVLWLKGMYTMIEAFEVTQDRDDRKIKDELRDKFASALKNTSGAPISIDRLWDEIKAEHEAKYQAQLEIDNEVLIAALGAACVWITLGGLTATYLDKNSYILRQELSAQIDNDSFPGYMDIRWGRHPYATGNLNLEGLLKDWHKRYGLWHRRLIQIIDDHSSDSWLFHLARQASNQIMEDWLEQETEYFISQPVGSLLPEWEREIEHTVEHFRTKRGNGRNDVPNSAVMPTGPDASRPSVNRQGTRHFQHGNTNQQAHHQQQDSQPNGIIRNGILTRHPAGVPTSQADGRFSRRTQQGVFTQWADPRQQSSSNPQAGPSGRQPSQQVQTSQANGVFRNRGSMQGLPGPAAGLGNGHHQQQWNDHGFPGVPAGFDASYQEQRQPNSVLGSHQVNVHGQDQQSSQSAPRIPLGPGASRQHQHQANTNFDNRQANANHQGQRSQPNRSQPRNHFQQRNGQNQNRNINQQGRSRPLNAHEQRRQELQEERQRICEASLRRSVVKKLVTDHVLYYGWNLRNGKLGIGEDER